MGKIKQRIPAKLVLILALLALFVCYPAQAEEQAEEVKTEIVSNFEVYDTDIRDVYRSLAELGGINILMDPQVKGNVSIKLKHGLEIKEAIELLSQTYGFSFRWINKTRTVIIGNEKTFSNFESRETKIYHLNYASPEQVKNALKMIVAEDKIGIDPRTNQITVKASILEHQNIAEIVTRLDREVPQINIEARIEELTESATKELGILWTLNSTTSSSFKITASADIEALEETNKAHLLANPNISVSDSQEGKILIGTKFPVITSSETDDGTEYTINYIEYGTKLTVTPRINENDIITVSLKAEISDVTEWKTTGDGDDVPVIKTREASSVVRLREGETFVLSGLYQQEDSTSGSGLPGLSRIPLVGRLFGANTKANEKTQIVIFLTPKIIRFNSNPNDNSNVHTIGKQPTESEAPKTVTELVPAAPIINTPIVREETSKKELSDSGKPGAVNIPLQEEPVDKELPLEEKELPDLSKLPKTLDSSEKVATSATPVTPSTTAVSIPASVKPADAVKVKVKAKMNETIASLAKKYGIDQASILDENKLKTGTETFAVGTNLVLPIPKNHFYELKPKETLWRIAKRYGSTVELLMEINNITDISKVGKGRAIILPVAVDKVVNSKF